MTEHQIVSGVDRPNETPKERRERIKANEAEFARRRREDTPRDILRRRLDALNDDELYGGAAAAVRAVHKLAFSPVGYFECLIADDLDGLAWLAGHAELDNDISWCGSWHVEGRP
jgi:hypothetical protein